MVDPADVSNNPCKEHDFADMGTYGDLDFGDIPAAPQTTVRQHLLGDFNNLSEWCTVGILDVPDIENNVLMLSMPGLEAIGMKTLPGVV